MDPRRELIGAIAQLTSKQKSQLLLFVLEGDWQALEIIDGRKWAFHEWVDGAPERPRGEA